MKKKLNLLVTALLLTNTLASCISMVDSKTDREAIVTCQTDADCGAGLECEIEHGASFCKPHGGDDQGGGEDAGATPTGPNAPSPPAGTCQTDADCGAGLECEIEHGTSFCKPHGGDDGDNGDDDHGGDDD